MELKIAGISVLRRVRRGKGLKKVNQKSLIMRELSVSGMMRPPDLIFQESANSNSSVIAFEDYFLSLAPRY